jgi:hypothetical protein
VSGRVWIPHHWDATASKPPGKAYTLVLLTDAAYTTKRELAAMFLDLWTLLDQHNTLAAEPAAIRLAEKVEFAAESARECAKTCALLGGGKPRGPGSEADLFNQLAHQLGLEPGPAFHIEKPLDGKA